MSKWTRFAETDEQEKAITKIEKTLKTIGVAIVGGTTIGKSPQTVILDVVYQGNDIYINSDGNVKVSGEEVEPSDTEAIVALLSNIKGVKMNPKFKKAVEEKDLYLVVVEGDIEPEVHGPYATSYAREDAAKKFRSEDPEMRNGIFPMDITKGAKVKIGTFSGGFFDEEM